ncbi:MAG: DUF4430 domain-containing protein [Clostridia bacterium]|nr:DUF4430 domain-containing protein [Clostridia bacterium]
MKKTHLTKMLSFILCLVLVAAIALISIGCNGKNEDTSSLTSLTSSVSEPTKVGQGATKFTFTVVDASGKETIFEVSTDKTLVSDALLEEGLIAGEDSQYGLYVKTVNGTTLDFDKDGKYWAFYVNGAYGQKGVSET